VPSLSDIPALDAVIGLAFVYFVLSLVLSSVTEALSAVLQVRWKKLEQGLRELFLNSGGDSPEAKAEAQQLWVAFQQNERIKALWKQTGALGARGPSYIPPRVLALTLIDTLAPPLEESAPTGGGTAATHEEAKAAPAAADARAAADAGADEAKTAVATGRKMVSNYDLVARAERAAGSVGNPLFRKWLLDALSEVDPDREKILRSLESSFNSVTDRVSGWYKRYSAIVIAVLAIASAGALNVDSYAIGVRLWKNDAVRSAIASQAANLTSAKCPTLTSKTASSKLSLEQASECVSALRALGLPIGWAKPNQPNTAWGWVGKVFGIIVTAFAVMLGAPFWFDTLSKLAKLRAAGNPPALTSDASAA
jgi:hypothetical protein